MWAFEPNSESHRCAEVTLLLNRIDNVRLRNAGLGAAAGESLVQVANKNGRAVGGAPAGWWVPGGRGIEGFGCVAPWLRYTT